MTDPFRAEAIAERLRSAASLLVLAAALVALALLFSRTSGQQSESVQATVVRLGSRPTDVGYRPVVTVRLPDGSIRQLLVRPNAVRGCKKGDSISLLRVSTSLRVGMLGCQKGPQS
jgi:hypothetical protein